MEGVKPKTTKQGGNGTVPLHEGSGLAATSQFDSGTRHQSQTAKTVTFCKRHDRPVLTGGDCSLCHDAGMKTEIVQKIHFADLPKDEQDALFEILRSASS